MTAKATAVFDGDTSALSAKLGAVKKKAGDIGKEFVKAVPEVNKLAGSLSGLTMGITAGLAGLAQWNKELERGKRLLNDQKRIAQEITSGGDVAQAADVRAEIERNLGTGALNKAGLTDIYSSFKAYATSANAEQSGKILEMSQAATGSMASPQMLNLIASVAGQLVAGGVDEVRAYTAAFYISQEAGGRGSRVLESLGALASTIGGEAALALVPALLATRESPSVAGTMQSEAQKMAMAGMSGSEIAGSLSYLLSPSQAAAASQYAIPDAGYVERTSWEVVKNLPKSVRAGLTADIIRSQADKAAGGNAGSQKEAARVDIGNAIAELQIAQESSQINRALLQAGNFDAANALATSDKDMEEAMFKALSRFYVKDQSGAIKTSDAAGPSLKPNGQE